MATQAVQAVIPSAPRVLHLARPSPTADPLLGPPEQNPSSLFFLNMLFIAGGAASVAVREDCPVLPHASRSLLYRSQQDARLALPGSHAHADALTPRLPTHLP